MKKLLLAILLLWIFFSIHSPVVAQIPIPTPTPPYEACGGSGCPTCPEGTPDIVCNSSSELICAPNYEGWLQDKTKNYWVVDPEVTALGRGGERSRQFLFWNLNFKSIDNISSLINVWSFSRNITYALLFVVIALFGIGIVIGRKYTGYKIEVFPLILKILGLFLYTAFSSFIVLLIIQLSDTVMLFFTQQLGVEKLFNIFFTSGGVGESTIKQSESAYRTFQGCSNLNINYFESVRMSKFLVQTTNITYYLIGIMLILRRVVLWFLLFVSPFLAILIPFVFIRNIGWIWIGVFFQWVFYGPLLALFLGGVASIWNSPTHIPFIFNFARAHTSEGHIFPTAINILYGGPAQTLGFFNSSNYIDTFAEYVISLIMLWAAIFFPWWLLRIFRDYCCEGIYSMRNTLISMYDQMRGGPPSPLGPSPSPSVTSTSLQMPHEIEIPVKIKMETIEEIKRYKTEEITRSLNLSASRLTDVAHFETNRQVKETVMRNIDYLANPTKAETPQERQKYMNIRTELFNRAIKEDRMAKQILSSISTSPIEKIQKREELTRTIPQMVPATQMISVKVQIPREKVSSINNSFVRFVSQNNPVIQSISQSTHASPTQVQSVLQTFVQTVNQPVNQIVSTISKETGVPAETVSHVIQTINHFIQNSKTITQAATIEQLPVEQIEKVINAIPLVLEQKKETTLATHIDVNKTPSAIIRISEQVAIPQETAAHIVQTIFNTVSHDTIMMREIERVTGLADQQVQSVLQTFVQNINQPADTIVATVSEQTGINKETVINTITTLVKEFKLLKEIKETIKSTATIEQVKERDVENIVTTQLPIISEPQKNIEQTVSIPPTVSIEDYENVKRMWTNQYEKGEIPITENITSRKQWVDQDTIFITNTLNKLLSPNDTLQQEGLDDLGYILPVFLINNLKGEELVVYLKAKLEAAKIVQTMLEKEYEVREKIKGEEETVTVEKPKAEKEQKTMTMEEKLEQKIETPLPKPSEDHSVIQ